MQMTRYKLEQIVALCRQRWVRSATNDETASNKSSFSERRRLDSVYNLHPPIRDQQVSRKSLPVPVPG